MKKQFKANQRQEKRTKILARETVDLAPEQQSPLFSLRYMNKEGASRLYKHIRKGSRIRACVLSTIRKIFSANASPLQKRDALNKDYSFSQCTKDEKAAFADTLYKLSQLTWSQINASGRHGSGYEKIAQSSIRAAIPSHLKDDVNFIAFRFCGMAPMVGYRDGAVLYIIWLDRDFTLYPH